MDIFMQSNFEQINCSFKCKGYNYANYGSFYIAILLPIKYKKQIHVCRKRMSSHNLAIENGRHTVIVN